MSHSVPPPLPLSDDDSDDISTRIDGIEPARGPLDVPDVPSAFGPGRRSRYHVKHLLGEGGIGRVYAAFDRDLRREVAIKTMDAHDLLQRDIFMREARVTAGLSHPNVPPLYDVGQGDGVFFLSMQRARGKSLGALIREAIAEGATEVMPTGRLVEVMLKMCDAVAYAHAHSVVHGDIKPDNVMIGAYGEVMLVDWGAARRVSARDETGNRVIGTPAYMAPEQAAGHRAAQSFDIYALGASLFHALLLRKPLTKAAKNFWTRKLHGEFDEPTTEEWRRAPRPLLSIALKAISFLPEERYATASEFGEALRNFQAGRNVWAAPLVNESLLDDSYLERWVSVPQNAFERSSERLVSRAPAGALLFYRQRMSHGVALEFDGEILTGERPGDLSVVWTDDDVLEPTPHWPKRGTCLSLQVGAFDNLTVGIYRDFTQCLSGQSLSIEVGKRYRIRAEVDENALRLWLDGEVIAEYDELFPLPSGHVALFSYAPGKAFSNIRLYERGVPERLRPAAIGDAFYGQADYPNATKQYARVEQLLPGTESAEEARFKRGLCAMRVGDVSRATALWQGLLSAGWRARAALHAIDVSFNARRHEEVVQELERLLEDVPHLREAVIDRWAAYVNDLCNKDSVPLPLYAELRARQFPDHPQSSASAAALEVARGNWNVVIERYAENHVSFVDACNSLGQFGRVVERYPNIGWIRNLALVRLCQLKHPALDGAHRMLARTLLGEVVATTEEGICAEAFLVTGRFKDVLTSDYVATADYAEALRESDRSEEAAELGDARSLALLDVGEEALTRPLVLEERSYLLHYLAVRAFATGDIAAYKRCREKAQAIPCSAYWYDIWIYRHFLVPLIDRELGDADAPYRSARYVITQCEHHWYRRAYYLARFVLGEIELEELEAQPVRLFMRAHSLIAQALKAEFVQHSAEASHHYAAYLSLPRRERHNDSPRIDPVLDRWVHYRVDREPGQKP